jgi:hypothetical protein
MDRLCDRSRTYMDKPVDFAEQPDRFTQCRVPVFEGRFSVEVPPRIWIVVLDYCRRLWHQWGGRHFGLGLLLARQDGLVRFRSGGGVLLVLCWVVEIFWFGLVSLNIIPQNCKR